jgi:hypothetical protein
MLRRSFLAAASSATLASAAQPFFNGRDLSTFEPAHPCWSVENGVIVGRHDGLKQNEFLRTKQQYADFDLTVDFWMKDGKGNSGIQFRSFLSPEGVVTGFQADAGQKYWGALYDESRRKKILATPSQEFIDSLDKNAWHLYRVRAKGPRIQIWLNKTPTVDYTETDPAIATTGFIAFQVHAGPALEVRFRNPRIKVL